MFRPVMAIVRFLQRLRRVYISVWGRVDVEIYRFFLIVVETWWWPLQAETCSFMIRLHHLSKHVVLIDYTFLALKSHAFITQCSTPPPFNSVINLLHKPPDTSTSTELHQVQQVIITVPDRSRTDWFHDRREFGADCGCSGVSVWAA